MRFATFGRRTLLFELFLIFENADHADRVGIVVLAPSYSAPRRAVSNS
jgi:hypothetical protein